MKHLWTVLALALLLTACSGAAAADNGIGDPGKGKQIYETGGASGVPCNTCHTTDGTTLVGPSFQGLPGRAGSAVEGLSAEEYLHQSIVDPGAHIVEGYELLMPLTYGDALSEADINNVVAYLMTLE